MIQYISRPAIIQCGCGNTLSVLLNEECLETRHQGRKLVISGTCEIEITCEKCSRTRNVALDRQETVAIA